VHIESSYIVNVHDLDMKHVKDFTFIHGKYISTYDRKAVISLLIFFNKKIQLISTFISACSCGFIGYIKSQFQL
jgi:hypothetical protein